MSLMHEIVVHTLKTIKSLKTLKSFEENLATLKELTNKLNPEYLGINPDLLNDRRPSRDTEAPVTYIEICHNPHFFMGVFVLKPGSRLPLHNHPNMHGILKVLHGSGLARSINAYPQTTSGASTPLLKISTQSYTEITPESEPIVLTPNNANIHEILPLVTPAAFIDILFPPYDDHDRYVSYYKTVSFKNSTNHQNKPKILVNSRKHENITVKRDVGVDDNYAGDDDNYYAGGADDDDEMRSMMDDPEGLFLEETGVPGDYWCDSLNYTGPWVPNQLIEDIMKDD